MKFDRRLVVIGGASAIAAPFISRAHAQALQILRLSHTDTPVGSCRSRTTSMSSSRY
jgi:hypothetical protein